MEEMRGTGFAGSVSPFLGRERAAIDVDVDSEKRWRRSPLLMMMFITIILSR